MEQTRNEYAFSGKSTRALLEEYVLRLHYTFGEGLVYVGTTTETQQDGPPNGDIDVMVVFETLTVAHLEYCELIVQRLMQQYNVPLDTRLVSRSQVESIEDPAIPPLNRYLLRLFLTDLYGSNPFAAYAIESPDLKRICLQRMRDQVPKVMEALSLVSWDVGQIRHVCQAVFDAVRAFLVLEDKPCASKESAVAEMRAYHGFPELESLYESYAHPNEVSIMSELLLDAHAFVQHLLLRATLQPPNEDVVLVNTPSSVVPHPRDDYLRRDPNMPLGLLCVASYCQSEGLAVSILDGYAENLGAFSTIDRLFSGERAPKVVAMNCSSPNVHIAHRIARYIKRISPLTVVVCGGAHATLAPEHTLSTGDVDYVVVGEGEIPFAELVRGVLANSSGSDMYLSGIGQLVGGKYVSTPNSEALDLASMTPPDFSLLPLDRYFSVRRRLYVHTTRGCAYRCVYCSVPKCWHGVREIPIEDILAHVKDSVERFNPDEIQIVDDNFSHRKGRIIRSFCEGYADRGLSVRWKCQARADQLDDELVALMASTNCFEIDLGVETGSPEMQKYIRKNLDLERTEGVVASVASHGIFCKAFVMLGFPNETYAQIAETLNYSVTLKKAGLGDVAFFPVMPFPGTDIAAESGVVVFQGATVDEADVLDMTFAGRRLRKYSAKPEVSLNRLFTPDTLRLLVRFAYEMFTIGAPTEDLEKDFVEFLQYEEGGIYGVQALPRTV